MIGQISARCSFEPASNQLRTCSEPAPNQLRTSSEAASEMEFGFNRSRTSSLIFYKPNAFPDAQPAVSKQIKSVKIKTFIELHNTVNEMLAQVGLNQIGNTLFRQNRRCPLKVGTRHIQQYVLDKPICSDIILSMVKGCISLIASISRIQSGC